MCKEGHLSETEYLMMDEKYTEICCEYTNIYNVFYIVFEIYTNWHLNRQNEETGRIFELFVAHVSQTCKWMMYLVQNTKLIRLSLSIVHNAIYTAWRNKLGWNAHPEQVLPIDKFISRTNLHFILTNSTRSNTWTRSIGGETRRDQNSSCDLNSSCVIKMLLIYE